VFRSHSVPHSPKKYTPPANSDTQEQALRSIYEELSMSHYPEQFTENYRNQKPPTASLPRSHTETLSYSEPHHSTGWNRPTHISWVNKLCIDNNNHFLQKNIVIPEYFHCTIRKNYDEHTRAQQDMEKIKH